MGLEYTIVSSQYRPNILVIQFNVSTKQVLSYIKDQRVINKNLFCLKKIVLVIFTHALRF
jgi:hypothetical protein